LQPMEGMSVFSYLTILCGVGLLLTALMSNIAMVNMFVPITSAIALSMNVSPEFFAIPVTIAASCDFMFPMSTPPNAIAYSSGYIPARLMFRTGVWLNLCSWLLLSALLYFWI
ncbi:MAG: SLC13 family permease, partial [Flavobacteriales bacterium]